jgi:hypothetical protein
VTKLCKLPQRCKTRPFKSKEKWSSQGRFASHRQSGFRFLRPATS